MKKIIYITLCISVIFSSCRKPDEFTRPSHSNQHTGLSPYFAHLSKWFCWPSIDLCLSYNPNLAGTRLVWAGPCSLAATKGITNCFLFLRVLRCFSSPGLLLSVTCLQHAGLPHSEIFGSKVICTFPKLIAAYRVLHRLREPRHPPCALNYFLWSLLIYLNLIVFFLYQYVKEHFS